jgi:hypothetical protein
MDTLNLPLLHRCLLKAWLDGSKFGSRNSISQYPARPNATELLFLSSTFVFQFGFSYWLTRRYYHAFSNAEPLAVILTATQKTKLNKATICNRQIGRPF